MSNSVDKLNIETDISGTLNNVKKFEIGKSKLSEKEIQEATIKADELTKLEKNFETKKTAQGTEGDETKKNISQKNSGILSPDIKTTINELNRPTAQKGLENSYVTIQNNMNTINQSVQNSKAPGLIKKVANRLFKQ